MQEDAAYDKYEALTKELFETYEQKPSNDELVNASSNLVRFFDLLNEIQSVAT
jgi:hypothetical protein